MNQMNPTQTAHRDNLLGVCAAVGDATGINPIVFRLGFVAAILFGAFVPAVVGYCIAGVAIKVAQR